MVGSSKTLGKKCWKPNNNPRSESDSFNCTNSWAITLRASLFCGKRQNN